EYYAFLLRKGYQANRKERPLSPREKRRMYEKQLKDLRNNYKQEKDPELKKTLKIEMTKIASNLFNAGLEKDSRYISTLSKKLKIVKGKYEHKVKNKTLYIDQIVNEYLK
ncbi:hypothetical protein BVX93_00325, partial [bacterium B13(2017)]